MGARPWAENDQEWLAESSSLGPVALGTIEELVMLTACMP